MTQYAKATVHKAMQELDQIEGIPGHHHQGQVDRSLASGQKRENQPDQGL